MTRLSKNFELEEFSGWQNATPQELELLQQTVDRVLQPTRDRWGPIVPTSWRTWSNGQPRTGAHARGAVDIVPLNAPIPDVHAWMARALRGRYGELIRGSDHIHVTPPGVGGDGEVLVAMGPGQYVEVDPTADAWRLPDGTVFELPPLEVTVAGPRTWLAWLILAFGLLGARRWA